MNDVARVAFVLLLVFGNAFFVAAEYALVTARRSRLEERAQRRQPRRARRAARSWTSPSASSATMQLGITVFGIRLGAIGEPLLAHYPRTCSPRASRSSSRSRSLTYLTSTLGELVPKAVALQRAESLALVRRAADRRFSRRRSSADLVAAISANAVLRLLRHEPGAGRDARLHAGGHPAVGRGRRGRRRDRSRPRRRCSTRCSTSPRRRSRT